MAFTLTFLKLFSIALFLLMPLLLIFITLILILGQVVARLERWPAFDGLYWACITATTVGYGDIKPARKSSRLIAVLIAMLGILFTGIVLAAAINCVGKAFEMHIAVELETAALWTAPSRLSHSLCLDSHWLVASLHLQMSQVDSR